jgi:hypothetical protein
LEVKQTAAEIVAFNMLIDNSDRRREKPNLLSKENELIAIDHEMSFAFTVIIGGCSESWLNRNFDYIREQHPLFSGLKGQPIDLGRFEGELAGIADTEIEQTCSTVPWELDASYSEKILRHLLNARDRADELVEAVRRILR